MRGWRGGLGRKRRGAALAAAGCLITVCLCGSAAWAASRDQELFNQAKILIFDKKWEEARQVFDRVAREFPASPLVPQAFYFSARCLQLQGRQEEALRAYETFQRKYPSEPIFGPEARSSIVELAATLHEKGNPLYKDRLAAALSDPNKDVRYFAAIRASGLGDAGLNAMVSPVLKDIVRHEAERDLVDRARIALLRLDQKALAPAAEAPPAKGKAEPRRERPSAQPGDNRMFHLVVHRRGVEAPIIELNLPFSLAELAIAALDESDQDGDPQERDRHRQRLGRPQEARPGEHPHPARWRQDREDLGGVSRGLPADQRLVRQVGPPPPFSASSEPGKVLTSKPQARRRSLVRGSLPERRVSCIPATARCRRACLVPRPRYR